MREAPARPGCPSDRDGPDLYAARPAETVRLPGPAGRRAAAPFFLFWVGAIMELAGGLLILVGLFTRPVAFLSRARDGGGLLDVSCAAEPLPGSERRRCRDPVLLRIPALRVHRTGRLEHRCSAKVGSSSTRVGALNPT